MSSRIIWDKAELLTMLTPFCVSERQISSFGRRFNAGDRATQGLPRACAGIDSAASVINPVPMKIRCVNHILADDFHNIFTVVFMISIYNCI